MGPIQNADAPSPFVFMKREDLTAMRQEVKDWSECTVSRFIKIGKVRRGVNQRQLEEEQLTETENGNILVDQYSASSLLAVVRIRNTTSSKLDFILNEARKYFYLVFTP
jgi:hypothetical protein